MTRGPHGAGRNHTAPKAPHGTEGTTRHRRYHARSEERTILQPYTPTSLVDRAVTNKHCRCCWCPSRLIYCRCPREPPDKLRTKGHIKSSSAVHTITSLKEFLFHVVLKRSFYVSALTLKSQQVFFFYTPIGI